MANFIKIKDELIRLEAINSEHITTPSKAVTEAIEFCVKHKLTECELDYDGYLFYITPTSDLQEKLKGYYNARGIKH